MSNFSMNNTKTAMALINQFFEIQQKLASEKISEKFERHTQKISYLFETSGYTVHNPIGEKYTDSRTDCEASIIGPLSKNMVITQVVKPVIYYEEKSGKQLVQKAIVMVEKAP